MPLVPWRLGVSPRCTRARAGAHRRSLARARPVRQAWSLRIPSCRAPRQI